MKRKALFLFFYLAFSASAFCSDVLLFYSPHCHACHVVIEKVLPALKAKMKQEGKILLFDVEKADNLRRLLAWERILGVDKKHFGFVPAMVIGDKVLVGRQEIEKNAFSLWQKERAKGRRQKPTLKKYSLKKYFLSFGLFTVLLAGAIDGINPCAFSCIVFFMAFLAFKGYRRRQMVVVGAGFILAVFLTYLALGFGVFNFLYRWRTFHHLIKGFYLMMAWVALGLGIISLYDWILYERRKDTKRLVLQIPLRFKQAIHKLIHFFLGQRKKEKTVGGLFLASFLSGVLVSLLEAVCTGQVYLPTIVFILKNSSLKIRAFFYFLAYNLMFILPLAAVFFFSLLGVSSQRFSALLQKHLGLVKLLLAILFLFLAWFLFWAA